MELLSLEELPATVLVVVAHPDDIDFGVAGSAAVLAGAGTRVVYAICTSGEAGAPEEMDRAELAALRQREQRAAAAVVGVNEVLFLGMPDGHIEANLELRKVISRVIRQVKPDVVISQSPERRYDRIYASHPDHLACAEATISAVYPDARNPHSHTELLKEGHEPHTVPEVWVTFGPDPDLAVDIGDTIDLKAKALSSHSSQVGWIDDISKMLRGWGRDTAKNFGVDDRAEFVEVFQRIATG